MPKKAYKIKITQEDIDRTGPVTCFNCPVAESLKRRFPRMMGFKVYPCFHLTGFTMGYELVGISLSKRLVNWIRDYDAWRNSLRNLDIVILPGTFTVYSDDERLKC